MVDLCLADGHPEFLLSLNRGTLSCHGLDVRCCGSPFSGSGAIGTGECARTDNGNGRPSIYQGSTAVTIEEAMKVKALAVTYSTNVSMLLGEGDRRVTGWQVPLPSTPP